MYNETGATALQIGTTKGLFSRSTMVLKGLILTIKMYQDSLLIHQLNWVLLAYLNHKKSGQTVRFFDNNNNELLNPFIITI